MKKILAAILVLTLTLGACACALAEGAMTYADYCAAETDDEVTIDCWVQATQSWWQDKITVYAADADGAYFIYNMACAEEDAAKLVPGAKIRVTGYKAEWSGEIELAEGATFEFVEGDPFIAEPVDVTGLFGTDALFEKQNQKISVKGATVAAKGDDGAAFLYGWDGSGEDGSDLYFDCEIGGVTYTFVVESYLTGPGTEVYEGVKALQPGDVIDMEGFLYWYEGPQAHITAVAKAS